MVLALANVVVLALANVVVLALRSVIVPESLVVLAALVEPCTPSAKAGPKFHPSTSTYIPGPHELIHSQAFAPQFAGRPKGPRAPLGRP